MKTFKKKFKAKKKMEKEVYFLNKLSSYECFPRVVRVDKDANELEMSFCGNLLEEGSEPRLWKKQMKDILNILEKERIYHNDMHNKNFLHKDGKIFLIDFGEASEGHELFPFLNVNSSCVDSCNSFFHFIIKAEQNLKRSFRI
jgi:predicted Ser/Thr protein kinase